MIATKDKSRCRGVLCALLSDVTTVYFRFHNAGPARSLPSSDAFFYSAPCVVLHVPCQHFLTRQQREYVDHERRLTADRMRRLNQVLAGYVGFAEVKVQEMKASSEKSSPAPSHGSAVGNPFHEGPSVDQELLATKSSTGSGDQTLRNTVICRLVRGAKRIGLSHTGGTFRATRTCITKDMLLISSAGRLQCTCTDRAGQ